MREHSSAIPIFCSWWRREFFVVTKLDKNTQMQFEFKINRTLQEEQEILGLENDEYDEEEV